MVEITFFFNRALSPGMIKNQNFTVKIILANLEMHLRRQLLTFVFSESCMGYWCLARPCLGNQFITHIISVAMLTLRHCSRMSRTKQAPIERSLDLAQSHQSKFKHQYGLWREFASRTVARNIIKCITAHGQKKWNLPHRNLGFLISTHCFLATSQTRVPHRRSETQLELHRFESLLQPKSGWKCHAHVVWLRLTALRTTSARPFHD